MAHHADAGNHRRGEHLAAARILVDDIVAQLQGFAIVAHRQAVLVGPDGIGVGAVVLAFPCEEHENLLHLAVAVPVVPSPVYGVARQLACLGYHLATADVVRGAVAGILTIILITVREFYRSNHIEREVELPPALTKEIVAHTAPEPHAVGEVLRIGDIEE